MEERIDKFEYSIFKDIYNPLTEADKTLASRICNANK